MCLMAVQQCRLQAKPVDTGAQHNADWVELWQRFTAARGLNKAQFICNISHFATWLPTIPHISSAELAIGVLYPSHFLHRSAHFKLLRVMVVFRHPSLLWKFLCLPYPHTENQIYKSKRNRGWVGGTRTEGHLNPFRVPKLQGVK